MKKLLSFLLVAGLSVSLFAIDIFNYAPVAGRVKSYTETEYTISSKFGNYLRTPNIKVTHTFDNFGRETDSLESTARDKIIDRISSEYTDAGVLVSQTCTNADEEVIWTREITYKDGKKTETSEYNAAHTLKAKVIYIYENDLLVDETGYDGDGALVWKTINKYDEEGRLSVESLYYSDGTLDERKTYSYTDEGLVNTITVYNSFSDTQIQQIFRYGTNGLLNEITTYNGNGEISARIVVKYDTKGNVTRISEYNIVNKFDTTINDLVYMKEVSYVY